MPRLKLLKDKSLKTSNRTEKELLERYAELRTVFPAALVGTIFLLIMFAMAQECVICTEFIQKTVRARFFILLETFFLFVSAFATVERWRIRRLLAQIKTWRDAGIYVEPAPSPDPIEYWDTPRWKETTLFLLTVTTVFYLCIVFLRLADLRLVWWPNLMMLIMIGIVWGLRRSFPKRARVRRTGLVFYAWKVFSAIILAAPFVIYLYALFGVLPANIIDPGPSPGDEVNYFHLLILSFIFHLGGVDELTLDLHEKNSSKPEK